MEFTNVKEVYIGNKEVKQLSIGNDIIWRKENYSLILNSDKNIISHSNSETATITATLTNNNYPATGKTVVFKNRVFLTSFSDYVFTDCFEIDISNWTPSTELLVGNSNQEYFQITMIDNSPTLYLRYINDGNNYSSTYAIEKTKIRFCNDTLTVSTYDGGSNTVFNNIDLSLWSFSSDMGYFVVDEYLGTGVTDNNGQCSVQYISKGLGELNIVAECMSLQETYNMIDSEWIYDGRTNSQSSSWYNYQSYITTTYGEDGTTATTDGAIARYLFYNDSTISSTKVGGYYSIPNNYAIEFDVTATTGSVQLVFLDDESTANQRFVDINGTGHYKCEMNGFVVIIYKDNQQQGSPYTLTGNNVQFRFGFNAENESITFKNFIVYPIFKEYDYYSLKEVSRSSKNGSTIYDNNLSISLPFNCEVSFDYYSNIPSSVTGYDHRFFLLPKSQFNTGTTQPQYALYVNQSGANVGYVGKRENNSTIGFGSNFSMSGSTYHTMKWIIDGTTVECYVDDVLKATEIISWIRDYTNYTFSIMIWSSSATSKMKNVKIKKIIKN